MPVHDATCTGSTCPQVEPRCIDLSVQCNEESKNVQHAPLAVTHHASTQTTDALRPLIVLRVLSPYHPNIMGQAAEPDAQVCQFATVPTGVLNMMLLLPDSVG